MDMIKTQNINNKTYIIESLCPVYEGLIIHGYGGNKEEILELATYLAQELKLKLVLFDLPGHGNNKEKKLNLKSAQNSLNKALSYLEKPSFFIGHSLGARLGFMANLPIGVAISMPGEAFFEGSKKELVKVLRYKLVNEESPYSGLTEIINKPINPAQKTFLLQAQQELASVNKLNEQWVKSGIENHKIANSSHLDIISAPQTFEMIHNWLKENL